MKAAEIKKQLHEQIDQIDDSEFLRALKSLLNSRLGNSSPFEFSEQQLDSMAISRAQIALGEGVSNEDVFSGAEEWLDGK
jgi:hypothetical protein